MYLYVHTCTCNFKCFKLLANFFVYHLIHRSPHLDVGPCLDVVNGSPHLDVVNGSPCLDVVNGSPCLDVVNGSPRLDVVNGSYNYSLM